MHLFLPPLRGQTCLIVAVDGKDTTERAAEKLSRDTHLDRSG